MLGAALRKKLPDADVNVVNRRAGPGYRASAAKYLKGRGELRGGRAFRAITGALAALAGSRRRFLRGLAGSHGYFQSRADIKILAENCKEPSRVATDVIGILGPDLQAEYRWLWRNPLDFCWAQGTFFGQIFQ